MRETGGPIPTQKAERIFPVIAAPVFLLYIYHNPVRWDAVFYNFPYLFHGLSPLVPIVHAGEIGITLAIWLAGLGLGRPLARRLIPPGFPVPEWIASMALGWGALGYLITALAFLGAFAPATVTGAALACSAAGLVDSGWGALRRPLRPADIRSRIQWPGAAPAACIALLLVTAYYAFSSSLMPPTQSDGLRYHLTVPKIYLWEQQFTTIPGIAFSNFPFLIEYLYAIPLAAGMNSGPKLLHFSYFLLTLGLVYHLGIHIAGRRTGLLAALMVAATPFVPIFASWSFIEFALAFYTLFAAAAAMHILEIQWIRGESPPARAWILAGAASGLMICCKYTAVAPAALLFAACAAAPAAKTGLRRGAAGPSWFAAAAALVGGFWFAKNWVLLGNPMYPFLRSLFPAPGWSEFNAEFFAYHAGIKGGLNAARQSPLWYQAWDLATLPFRLTFFPGSEDSHHPQNFGAWPVGALWLSVAALFPLRRNWTLRAAFLTAFSVFLFLLWALTYRDTRFLLPCLAALAPVAAKSLTDAAENRVFSKMLVMAVFLYNLAFVTGLLLLPGKYAPWWVVGGSISEEEYLEEWSDFTRHTSQAFRFLEENADPADRVLLHGIDQPFYCPNRFIHADWFDTDPLVRWSWESETAGELLERLQSLNIRYLVHNYGQIARYNTGLEPFLRFGAPPQPYYRFFTLPPDVSLPLLREWISKEQSRLRYPYDYKLWVQEFVPRLERIHAEAPNTRVLNRLLEPGLLREAFRYDEDETNPFEGIAILEIPRG